MNWHLQTVARSRAEGEAEAAEEVAKNLFAMVMDDAFVSRAIGLDIGAVQRMRASMCA